jgi:3-dehydroquinate dehydratase-1
MKIVASLTDAAQAAAARDHGADIIELRLDLMEGDAVAQAALCKKTADLPVIATLRSAQEGGKYFGNADEWLGRLTPVLPFVDYVDIELRFRRHADAIREQKKTIIASFHTREMPPLFEIFGYERDLRTFGDIVKIVVTPRDMEDVFSLITFTHTAQRPICTGVIGTAFRYARAILPLFGSELVYCHAGTPTADGQYSVGDFVRLMDLLAVRQRG